MHEACCENDKASAKCVAKATRLRKRKRQGAKALGSLISFENGKSTISLAAKSLAAQTSVILSRMHTIMSLFVKVGASDHNYTHKSYDHTCLDPPSNRPTYTRPWSGHTQTMRVPRVPER